MFVFYHYKCLFYDNKNVEFFPYVLSLAQLSLCLYMTVYIQLPQFKKKDIDKNCKELMLENMLMDLPLIVLIIETSFLHFNIV